MFFFFFNSLGIVGRKNFGTRSKVSEESSLRKFASPYGMVSLLSLFFHFFFGGGGRRGNVEGGTDTHFET